MTTTCTPSTPSRESRETCCVPNCLSQRSVNQDLIFHGFPKDKERCKLWILNTRRADLLDKSLKYLHNGKYTVCSKHFDNSQYTNLENKKYLISNAIPTHFDFTDSNPLIWPTSKQAEVKKESPEKTNIKNKTKVSDDVDKTPVADVSNGDGSISNDDSIDNSSKEILKTKEDKVNDTDDDNVMTSPKSESSLTVMAPSKDSARKSPRQTTISEEKVDAATDGNERLTRSKSESSVTVISSPKNITSKSSGHANVDDCNSDLIKSPKFDRSSTPLSKLLVPIVKLEMLPESEDHPPDQAKRVNVDEVPSDRGTRRSKRRSEIISTVADDNDKKVRKEGSIDEKLNVILQTDTKTTKRIRSIPPRFDDFVINRPVAAASSNSDAVKYTAKRKKENTQNIHEELPVADISRARRRKQEDPQDLDKNLPVAEISRARKRKQENPQNIDKKLPVAEISRAPKRKKENSQNIDKKITAAEISRAPKRKIENPQNVDEKLPVAEISRAHKRKRENPQNIVEELPVPEVSPAPKRKKENPQNIDKELPVAEVLYALKKKKEEIKDKVVGQHIFNVDQGFVVDNVSYAIINKGTQRGGTRLVGSDGYTYNLRAKYADGRIVWRCAYRPTRSPACKVVLRQYKRTGKFFRKDDHSHEPQPSAFINSLVSSEIKRKAKSEFLRKPKEVIEDILNENADLINQSGCEFNVDCLVRNFNRGRANIIKQKELAKIIKAERAFPDEFWRGDAQFRSRLHTVFATKKQLQLLSRTDRWFIDITRKFVHEPYTHLLTISAYVELEEPVAAVKLKPLAFACMSSVFQGDFDKVIRRILRFLQKPVCVRSLVLDYYEGLWSAVRALFFNCRVYGCAWKFGQCVWSKIQKIGLQEEQMEMYDQIHKILKLPFVPSREIVDTFEILKEEFLSDPSFDSLVDYLTETWLYNRIWRVNNWSVFKNPFRTKAEVIGWHYCIRTQENANLQCLVKELHKISNTIPENTKTIFQLRVRKFYLENDNTPQGKIFHLWENHSSFHKSEFLTLCCQLSEPVMDGMVERMVQEYRMQMKEYT